MGCLISKCKKKMRTKSNTLDSTLINNSLLLFENEDYINTFIYEEDYYNSGKLQISDI